MSKTEKQPIGFASDDQIDAWKNKYKAKFIHEIITEDEEGNEHASYVRKPDLPELQLLADSSKRDGEIIALKKAFQALRVGGSDEVVSDAEMVITAGTATLALFKKKKPRLNRR